jgi:ABC-type uncharacterized transport system permease subunit
MFRKMVTCTRLARSGQATLWLKLDTCTFWEVRIERMKGLCVNDQLWVILENTCYNTEVIKFIYYSIPEMVLKRSASQRPSS